MKYYDLPKSIEIEGINYEIRSDFRVVLDIFCALNDPDLSDRERGEVVLDILYPSFYAGEMPPEHYEEALKKALWFINGGEENKTSTKPMKLMDWEQDFTYIVAPVNRVAGCEVRSLPYLHWWTFLSFYNEIGECLFSQIVGIRKKRKTGKKLDKSEREWYLQNRSIVDFKTHYTEQEDDVLKQWIGGK